MVPGPLRPWPPPPQHKVVPLLCFGTFLLRNQIAKWSLWSFWRTPLSPSIPLNLDLTSPCAKMLLIFTVPSLWIFWEMRWFWFPQIFENYHVPPLEYFLISAQSAEELELLTRFILCSRCLFSSIIFYFLSLYPPLPSLSCIALLGRVFGVSVIISQFSVKLRYIERTFRYIGTS